MQLLRPEELDAIAEEYRRKGMAAAGRHVIPLLHHVTVLEDRCAELLAVCKEYIAYREGNDGCIDEIAPRMKAAIAKATGA